MRFAGQPSWEFAESDSITVQGALYVRDALRLDVGDYAENPPPLRGPVPDRSAVLEPAARAVAAGQWPSWWQAMVGWETGPRPDLHEFSVLDGSEREAWIHTHEDLGRPALPPDFAALSDRPELRRGARATYLEGNSWSDAPWRSLEPADRRAFAWPMVRDVAEDVAFDRGVGIGDVRGYAMVLDVEGLWWQPFAPGVVCCSRAAAGDTRAATAILRLVFESNLPA